ncbi:transcription elongation factor GreB [Neolewinella xylanilytica]|uniref:Transcription elongation factor GreB n=1 Tax=Neolewinella xylanilytica TaxID=1514080 RepID=A0A2S6I3A2_9BACT|nr:GreA/GreB family elongation factor [Neolewinella xylanilytica]PPK85645.1 transcription elongation factor GreB [Neolewinella xylanilytica]
MSRGFVKESDQETLPIIPLRPPLPVGATNYVTPAGLRALQDERDALEADKSQLSGDNEDERRRAATVIDGKLNLLSQRISSARVLDPGEQPQDEVRFGARVRLLQQPGNRKQEFQIVGVDEANVREKKISFTAPIAQAITGLRVGERADFRLGNEVRKLEVLEIAY